MARTLTALMVTGVLLSMGCHHKKKPEAPPEQPIVEPLPQQPAPVRGPRP